MWRFRNMYIFRKFLIHRIRISISMVFAVILNIQDCRPHMQAYFVNRWICLSHLLWNSIWCTMSIQDELLCWSFCSTCDYAQPELQVLKARLVSWLQVHISSSSCKGTSGLLHILRSNTMIFTALHVMQTRYSDENSVRLSVRPSVCHTRVLWQNGRKICPDLYTIRKNI